MHALTRPNPEVMVAFGAYLQILIQLLVEDHGVAFGVRALGPEPLRNFTLAGLAAAELGLFGEGRLAAGALRRWRDGWFDCVQAESFLIEGVCCHKLKIVLYVNSPRATVQTHTSRAPCWRKTFAQALEVAPVVKTSSTNTTRLPFGALEGVLQANAP